MATASSRTVGKGQITYLTIPRNFMRDIFYYILVTRHFLLYLFNLHGPYLQLDR